MRLCQNCYLIAIIHPASKISQRYRYHINEKCSTRSNRFPAGRTADLFSPRTSRSKSVADRVLPWVRGKNSLCSSSSRPVHRSSDKLRNKTRKSNFRKVSTLTERITFLLAQRSASESIPTIKSWSKWVARTFHRQGKWFYQS